MRQVPAGHSPAEFAFEQYFAGPTDDEVNLGAGGVLIGDDWQIDIGEQRITIDVGSSLPSSNMLLASSSLIFSLRLTGQQFAEVVEIELDSVSLSEYSELRQ